MKKRIGLLTAVLVAGLLCYLLFERQHDTGDNKQPRWENSPLGGRDVVLGQQQDIPVRESKITRKPAPSEGTTRQSRRPATEETAPAGGFRPPGIERQPEQEDAVAPESPEQKPDTEPPKILSGPVVTAVTENSATIEWTTDEPADGVVEFGTDTRVAEYYLCPKYSWLRRGDSGKTKHSVVLRGLSPGTCYQFRVGSTDMHGNGPTMSHNHCFITFGMDKKEASGGSAQEVLYRLWGNGALFYLTRATVQRSREEAKGEGIGAKVLWKRDLPNDVDVDPIALGEKWVIGDDRGHVLCLESQTGEVQWKVEQQSGRITYLRSFQNNIVAVTGKAVMLFAPDDGELIGKLDIENESDGLSRHVASDGQMLYLGCGSKLVAVDLLTRAVVWEQPCEGELGSRMVAGGGSVYIAEKTGTAQEGMPDTRLWTIWKLDGVTGNKIWSTSKSKSFRPETLHADKLYTRQDKYGEHLLRLSTATGEIEKTWRPWTAAPPAVKDGWLYLGTKGYPGTCCKMREEDGTIAWGFQTKEGDNWAKPQIGDGMIAFGSDDGFLYIVRDSTGEVVIRERVADFLRHVSYSPSLRQFVAAARYSEEGSVMCVQLTGGK